MGRRKLIPEDLMAAIQAANTHGRNTPAPEKINLKPAKSLQACSIKQDFDPFVKSIRVQNTRMAID